MKLTVPIIALLLFCCLIQSCEEEQHPSQEEPVILPDAVNPDGFAGVDPMYRIEPLGLRFAGLGQALNEMDTLVPGLGILQDTLVYDQGYFLATRTLHLNDGVVVVEGEYIDENEVNDTLIESSSVNRIRIESPSFRTASGLGVDMRLGVLQATYPEDDFYINPILGYGALDISRVSDTHIHYLISDPGNELARATMSQGEELTMEALPSDVQIFAIVLMR